MADKDTKMNSQSSRQHHYSSRLNMVFLTRWGV